MLKDEASWEQPYRFCPEHFLDAEGHFVKPEAFIPFSAGTGRAGGGGGPPSGIRAPRMSSHGTADGGRRFAFNFQHFALASCQTCDERLLTALSLSFLICTMEMIIPALPDHTGL